MISLMSSSVLSGAPFFSKLRIREMTPLARVPSFTIAAIASRNSWGFDAAPSSWRKQKLALVTIAVRGWLTS